MVFNIYVCTKNLSIKHCIKMRKISLQQKQQRMRVCAQSRQFTDLRPHTITSDGSEHCKQETRAASKQNYQNRCAFGSIGWVSVFDSYRNAWNNEGAIERIEVFILTLSFVVDDWYTLMEFGKWKMHIKSVVRMFGRYRVCLNVSSNDNTNRNCLVFSFTHITTQSQSQNCYNKLKEQAIFIKFIWKFRNICVPML